MTLHELREKLTDRLIQTSGGPGGWLSNVEVYSVDRQYPIIELRNYESIDVQHLVTEILLVLEGEGLV